MRFNVFFFVNAKVRTFAAEVQPHGYSGIRSSYIRCNPFLRPDFRKTSEVCHKGTILYFFLYNKFNNKHSSAATPKEFRSLLRLMVCDSARRWAIISFGGWRAAHGILPSGALNRCHGRR